VGRVGKGWLLFAESFARIFTEKRLHRNRAKPTSPAHKDPGLLKTAHSGSIGEIVTTELTERTPHPLAFCSVTWPAGRFPARRSFN
jgi:hypothetical protein